MTVAGDSFEIACAAIPRDVCKDTKGISSWAMLAPLVVVILRNVSTRARLCSTLPS
ncbi:hypothetical protein [Komagataeibacter sp. FNDCR2]|uniref:hypothetical protein n=1 Tax=Komagataeibacter sp. FNDCR2 TaxID=2878682 RepID=UPI001E5E7751|nr:hypothetical protein [Komagataeibacter sp. FNDCR2]MCE2575256.1 hypothetical protein [Komagataeibacter sp. FNDCR2]